MRPWDMPILERRPNGKYSFTAGANYWLGLITGFLIGFSIGLLLW